MALDLKALAKDKKTQVALGVGAVAGLVVLARSKGSAEASDTPAGTAPTAGGGAGGGGYLGGYDSTASDVYNNLQTSLDNRLDGFGSSITDLQDQLKKLQQKPAAPKPPVKKPPSKNIPLPKKPVGKTPRKPALTAHQKHVLHLKHQLHKSKKR